MTQRGLLFSGILIAAGFAAGLATAPSKRAGSVAKIAVAEPAKDARRGSTFVESPRDALERIGEHPRSEAGCEEVLDALLRWAAVDPESALDYARGHFDARHRSACLSRILAAWASREPERAWAWTKANFRNDSTQCDAVLVEIGRIDPDAAWRHAGELTAELGRTRDQSLYVSALRGIVYGGDYEKAARLVAGLQLPPGEERYDLTSFLAADWGRFDPQRAAAFAAAMPDDGGFTRQQTLVSIGVSWAQRDPQAVADFATQLPPGVARQNMLATALDDWATDHPDQAAQWLARHPRDPDFDCVVRSLASSPRMIATDPTLAASWANSISDENIRLQALKIVVDRWMATNYDAAKNYVEKAGDLPVRIQDILNSDLAAARSPGPP